MIIGLVDVDGHNFPNLALMRISAFHKAQGDQVEWWKGDLFHYDIVYMSKVFSDSYSVPIADPVNADKIIKGGTGYAITLLDGREIYDKRKDPELPREIENMVPDYSIYPEHSFAVAMTSRGCPRGCPFCHVAPKEGKCSRKVANVSDFWKGQKYIEVLDPNITACKDKHELFEQYRETGAEIVFNQGLDIRLLTDSDIEILSEMKVRNIHFAWDNPKENLSEHFKHFAELYPKQSKSGRKATVYVLTNYNSTIEEDLHRVYTLRDLGYDPYVMVYNKPEAPPEIRKLQRWCNAKPIFGSVPRFEDYKRSIT